MYIIALFYVVSTLALFIKSQNVYETKELGFKIFLVIPIYFIMLLMVVFTKRKDDLTGKSITRINRLLIFIEYFKGITMIIMLDLSELKIIDFENSKLLQSMQILKRDINCRIVELYKMEHSI